MPGHLFDKNSTESINKLSNLIQSHDVLFLVTDSRESRWLPTVLGAIFNKVLPNNHLRLLLLLLWDLIPFL